MKTEDERLPTPEPARGHDVFVSYSRADRERVIALTQGLAERGKRAWVDLEEIPPSAEWMAEIRSAIESADGYLVVVSPALAGSKVCAEELEHARSAGKRIVPVQVRPTDPSSVPPTLAALNWIDATGDELTPTLDRIVRALETDLDHTRAHTRLLVRASEWDHRAQDRSLLLRGQDLKDAEAFLVAAQGKEPAPTPVQARYVQTSRQGASRRQRFTVGAVAIALVVSLVLSAVALVQRSRSPGGAGPCGGAGQRRKFAGASCSGARAHGSRSRSRCPSQSRGISNSPDPGGDRRPAHRCPTLVHDRPDTRRKEVDRVGFTPEGGKKAVAYSPDGELIASGDDRGERVGVGSGLRRNGCEPFSAAVGTVYAIAFSPRAERSPSEARAASSLVGTP